jgi:signal transduction histidine kinase
VVSADHSVPPEERRARVLHIAAWTMGGLLLAAVAADTGLVLVFSAAVPSFDATQLSSLSVTFITIPTGAIGVLLAVRRPNNPTGWLLGGFAVFTALNGLGSDYGFHWLYGHDLVGSLAAPAMLLSAATGPSSFLALVMLLSVFPDGRPVSRRWRLFVWLSAALAILLMVAPLFDPTILGDGHRQLVNPIGIAGAHPLLNQINNGLGPVATFTLTGIGLISLIVRYRRADAEVRQQVKWFGLGMVILVAAVVVGLLTSPTPNWTTPIPVAAEAIGFTALPVCIAVAVLRYRLYDIDVVINRTLVYGALAAIITAVYIGIAVGLGTLVGGGGKPNLGLSILATAIVAVGFQPIRERLEKVANRVVYGKRATPYEVLARFSERVAESYASDEVLPRMARVLAEGTNSTLAEVWLRTGVGDTLHRAAVFPLEPVLPGAIQLSGGAEKPSLSSAGRMVEVRHQSELLGALTVTKRRGDGLTPIETRLMDDLAHQAGLVLKNVGLAADLRMRLDDLRASRQRLVAAQDDERRRIERNLHDGAQQHLVALKVKLGLVEMLTKRDPEKAKATIVALKHDADEALETLRDLARGIYPPLLADKGLAVALQSQAGKATLPVHVDADGITRYQQETEAALYFCTLEALQNVQKYAQASRVTVSLREEGDVLAVEVSDDGRGFDVTATTRGAGLTNMEDRLDALGGTLQIQSSPSHGTSLRATVPARRVVTVASSTRYPAPL